MKILLISSNTLTVPYPVYPLGLDYVAGVIPSHHEVKIVDMNELKSLDSLNEAIKDFSPDVIGISLRNIDNTETSDTKSFIEEYQQITGTIKKATNAPVVLGGSGFTIFPSEIMDALDADYGIIGEGERFNLLLDALEKNEDASKIPGVIISGAPANIPEPWDSAFFRGFDTDRTYINSYLRKGGMLNLQTKRGCTFECIYCTYPHIEGKRLRLIPPDEVAATAKMLQDAGARYLFITDSAFNTSYSHSTEVAQAFIKAGVTIPWGAFFAPTKPPADYYSIMADAGLTHVEFGTESLSNEMLKSYRKPFNVDDAFYAHKSACDEGLNIAHYLLLGGPGEDSNTLNETLTNADRLEKCVFFFFCGIRIYPHTHLYNISIEEGQITKSQSLLESVFYKSQSISSEEITRQVKDHAGERFNWIIGAGGEKTASIISRMYARGHSGPLWEHLIP